MLKPIEHSGKTTVLTTVGIEEWRSMTNADISRRVGVAAPNVSAYRRRHGLPKSPHQADASGVLAVVEIEEWRTLSNPEIARRKGVSRVSAWTYRKTHALPNPPTKARKPPTVAARVLAGVKPGDWRSLNDAEIARRNGVSLWAAWRYRNKHGLPNKPRSVLVAVGIEDWRSMNDYEIADRMGQSIHSVWAFRKKHGLPRSPGRRGDMSVPATVEIEG